MEVSKVTIKLMTTKEPLSSKLKIEGQVLEQEMSFKCLG